MQMVTWTHLPDYTDLPGLLRKWGWSQNHMFTHPEGEWASFSCPAPLSLLLLPLCPVSASVVLGCNWFVSMSVYPTEGRAKQNKVLLFDSQSSSHSLIFSRCSTNVERTNEKKIEKVNPVIIWLLRLGKQHHQCIINVLIWVISGNHIMYAKIHQLSLPLKIYSVGQHI